MCVWPQPPGERFAESIAYFDFSECNGSEKKEWQHLLNKWIKNCMPSGGKSNEHTFLVFKMCISSFIFHRKWLNNNLHTENLIRCSSFWSETIPLSDHVMTCYPWNRTVDTLEITGLPIDVLDMAKVESLELKLQRFKDAILNDNEWLSLETLTSH